MARPKKQINRRADIINAAQILFAEKGFEKTTIDDIAKYIGIGKGSVYLDFKNKDEIHLALVEKEARNMLSKIESHIQDAKPPYLEVLRQIIQNHPLDVFDMAISRMHTHATLIHTSYKVKVELDFLIQKYFDAFSTLLEKAANNGEIQVLDNYDRLAHLVCISMQGFFPPYDLKYSPNHRTDLTTEELRKLLIKDISALAEIILSGLKTAKI